MHCKNCGRALGRYEMFVSGDGLCLVCNPGFFSGFEQWAFILPVLVGIVFAMLGVMGGSYRQPLGVFDYVAVPFFVAGLVVAVKTIPKRSIELKIFAVLLCALLILAFGLLIAAEHGVI